MTSFPRQETCSAISHNGMCYSSCSILYQCRFLILTISSVIDRVFYGKWVNVHYNFLQFNFLSGSSEFFGTHPWHWYFTQGLPILLGSHIFLFVLAARKGMESVILSLIAWTTLVYRWVIPSSTLVELEYDKCRRQLTGKFRR